MITIVSGLPRSGTSLMMQMLKNGGMELLTDENRPADESNQNGYFEFEPVKSLQKENGWLASAESKAVKIIAQLLAFLPNNHQYKVIFMQRPLKETAASQKAMLEKIGLLGANLKEAILIDTFTKQLERIYGMLEKNNQFDTLYVEYHQILKEPEEQSLRINDFLDFDLDVKSMSRAVDASMWHQKMK